MKSPARRTSPREAHSFAVHSRSPDTERRTNSDSTPLLPRLVRLARSCLVQPQQGALGGFSYSRHVYTLAKQDLRTLRGGTEEEREVRPKAQGAVVWSRG